MKTLFCKNGRYARLVDVENRIFEIDNAYFNQYGEQVAGKKEYVKNYDDDEAWNAQQIEDFYSENPSLVEYLKSESITDIEWEIDDGFGCFGFKNKKGEFVIEPQYAYAHEFTNGLAAVNLNRTWYKTEKGERYYENHYGYIDVNGKTVIGFNYDEAWPFNKYGVAVVQIIGEDDYLIDMEGKEIPGTRFKYLSHYYEYNDRFLEFGYDYDASGDGPIGIYDTKERKILFEPKFEEVYYLEKDNCFEAYERDGEFGKSDFRRYYVDMTGNPLYTWLSEQRFAITEKPDVNNVAAVAISQYFELTGNPSSFFLHNGKKYERNFIYGLYSSKERFVLTLEYDDIRQLSDSIWACRKAEVLTIVETEPDD